MPVQAAARKDDQVSHTAAMPDMLIGLGIGVLAAVAIVATGGTALPVLLGAAAVAGGSGLAGELWGGAQDPSPCGPIVEGVPSIKIGPDAKEAAMATAHVHCNQHSAGTLDATLGDVVTAAISPLAYSAMTGGSGPQIAEGSATVFLSSQRLMAARVGDKGTCGFVIGEGCRTVIIGGPTGTAKGLSAGGEVPDIINYGLTALTLAPAVFEVAAAGSVAAGMLALGRIGIGLTGGLVGADLLGRVGERYGGKKGKAVGQLVGGLLGGYGASKGAGKVLPESLAGSVEGAASRGWSAVKGLVEKGMFEGGSETGGGAGVEAGPAAPQGAGGTSGAGGPSSPPSFQPHTPESLAQGQAAADAWREGIRNGDDLPGRSVADQAQALWEAILGRSRWAMKEAGEGGGGRGAAARAEFDKGGGVFSQKGSGVLETRDTGGSGGGTGGGGTGGGSGTSDPPDFTGRLRGQDVTLPEVKTRPLTYTKRTNAAREALRKQFDSKARFSGTRNNPGPVVENRANFLKDLANDPTKEASLRAAGIDDAGLAQMRQGNVPDYENNTWQVHHKLPLDDGGTNAQDNLVLMRNEPYHKVITNAQDTMAGDLNPGETAQIPNWPVPDGFVYPPVDPTVP